MQASFSGGWRSFCECISEYFSITTFTNYRPFYFHYRANSKDSLLSSASDLAREFNDRADDDRELEMEDNIVTALFVTAGERNEPADLHFSDHPKAHEIDSERVGWW